MKTIMMTIFMMVFLKLTDANAMTLGPTEVMECPGLREPLLFSTYASWNNIGATYWTDGKMEAPMYPKDTSIMKNEEEGVLFWTSQCKEVDQIGESENFGRWSQLNFAAHLVEDDYYRALDMKMGDTRNREIYLRIFAWQSSNDKFRGAPDSGGIERQAREVDNMEKLVVILDEASNESDRLLKAEVLRQLGRFDQAKNLLDFKFKADNQQVAKLLMDLVESRNGLVQQIQPLD